MKMRSLHLAAIMGSLLFAAPAFAQRPEPGTGPVAAACQQDIEKLCSDKEHGKGDIRACLNANKSKVGAACANALNTTGRGRNR